MKKILLVGAFFIGMISMNAQTKEELKTQKAEKQAEADKFQGEANALQAQIDNLPGWSKGAFGTVGTSLSGFSNWYSQGTPDVNSGSIGVTVNGFANLKQEKFFWRNALNVNLGWVKFDDENDPNDEEGFREGTDVFNISSLYGRNIAKNLAASALMEYRTTVLDNFNDPGYLDFGIGATWTPLKDLIVVVHPLNYNFVFADGDDNIFESSLGAKILVDYTRKIGAINFKSNVSAFQSYDSSDFSNFTWINSLGYTLWNKIGLGFEFGLRGNRQEALNFGLIEDPTLDFDSLDNDVQSYYLIGLNYSL